MSPAHKDHYDALAQEMQRSKANAAVEAEEHILTLLQLARQRLTAKEESAASNPMTLSDSLWTARDFQVWQAKFDLMTTNTAVESLAESMRAPLQSPRPSSRL